MTGNARENGINLRLLRGSLSCPMLPAPFEAALLEFGPGRLARLVRAAPNLLLGLGLGLWRLHLRIFASRCHWAH